jgi:uracil-DNA glycosylase
VANAVKHFRFEPRGKVRPHSKAKSTPAVVGSSRRSTRSTLVALGATAVQSLVSRSVTIGGNRRNVLQTDRGRAVFVTAHPSSLLRIDDVDVRQTAYEHFVPDLRDARLNADGPTNEKRGTDTEARRFRASRQRRTVSSGLPSNGRRI